MPASCPPGALAKQLALGVRRIVIDPGHGGRDYGAPGYLKGVHEKFVVLDISKRLAAKIRQRLGCETIMTRDTDRFLTLEERTAIANTRSADLFVSVHTNAARDRRAYGIETFFSKPGLPTTTPSWWPLGKTPPAKKISATCRPS